MERYPALIKYINLVLVEDGYTAMQDVMTSLVYQWIYKSEGLRRVLMDNLPLEVDVTSLLSRIRAFEDNSKDYLRIRFDNMDNQERWAIELEELAEELLAIQKGILEVLNVPELPTQLSEDELLYVFIPQNTDATMYVADMINTLFPKEVIRWFGHL